MKRILYFGIGYLTGFSLPLLILYSIKSNNLTKEQGIYR